MESRTRLAIGGMATVAASVTVICVVALTNSLALSESAGSPIDAAPVVVPAGASPADDGSARPTPTPTPSPAPDPVESEDPSDPRTPSPEAEVVPAPDAQVVVPVRPSPVAPSQPTAPALPSTQEEAIAQAQASGSWDPLRAWAVRHGWSDGRIDALISRLERLQEDKAELNGGRDSGGAGSGGRGDQSVQGAPESGRVLSPAIVEDDKSGGAVTGSSKERPANAGAGAGDRTERPGHGAKKDRSRDSPERRDR